MPLEKQYAMLKAIEYLYERGREGLKLGIPTSRLKNLDIFSQFIKMKYTIPNDDLSVIDRLKDEIDQYFEVLFKKYEN